MLMYYMGFTYSEYKGLSVAEKRWFMERVVQEINSTSKENGEATQSRAMQHNTPDVRALQNRVHPNAPAKLRRFT